MPRPRSSGEDHSRWAAGDRGGRTDHGAFPFLDAIVRNEADTSLCRLLGRWSDRRDLEDVPGVTWRRPDDAIARNVDAPLLQDLDALPYPAFDLYPVSEIDVALAPIEAARLPVRVYVLLD